jgi:hypothetical protein
MITRCRRSAPALVVALVFSMTLVAPPTTNAATQPSIPVSGTVLGGGTFSGVLTVTSFAVQNGQLVALGTLSGILTTAAGVVTSILTTISMPVSVAATSCEILHLDIGPISLDLLGLQVNLSQIVLNITAQPGPGNLLGNLLCAVTGLLDNVTGLAKLLNQILAAL